MTADPVDLLGARLARREWTVTVEVIAPPPADEAARVRILTLAEALHTDARVAALTLTDRTASAEGDPIALAPEVAARSGKAPLVHLAGKGRDAAGVARALRRAAEAGVASVLLTGGDLLESRAPGLTPARSSVDTSGVARSAVDASGAARSGPPLPAIAMINIARAVAPHIARLAVLPALRGRGVDDLDAGRAKRDAGASAFVAQVTWDPEEREIVAGWQADVGPVLGAVMLLTRSRLEFLAAHRITGIRVPAALRRRAAEDAPEAARERLALDLVELRRLGYAGAHLSGLLTPTLIISVLDEADRLWRSHLAR